MDPSDAHPLAPLVSTAVTAGTLLVAFTLLALGVDFFWVAFVVGFGGVLPVSFGLLAHAERTGSERPDQGRDEAEDTALATLRRQYARGEIGDAAFEERLERLLETESKRERELADEQTGKPRQRP
jgi:uncharacterized membrane protein